MLNQKVVARLLRLNFLRKFLARKPATFHIQTRYKQAKTMTIRKILFYLFISASIYSCDKKNNKKTEEIKEIILGYNNKAIQLNDNFVDFTMRDTYGKIKKISNLRGEYTLLEFWASWCGPCRRQNKSLVEIYKIYNSKGLNIIGISLDDNKKDWIRAIKSDNLIWENLSELKRWNCSAMNVYYSKGIPSNFLIDPNGKIIGRKLQPLHLKEVLEILIDKKNTNKLPYIKTRTYMYHKKMKTDTLIHLKKASL